MTLDEAIKHCEEVAKAREAEANKITDVKELFDCLECSCEHQQLAEWLKELKELRERPQGDLISREALKKEFEKLGYTYRVTNIIDNAPTVEPKTKLVANVTFDKEQMEELVEKAKADILEQIKRPHGKWGKWRISEVQCPNCFKFFETYCYSAEELNKCPNCGSEMKGGAE